MSMTMIGGMTMNGGMSFSKQVQPVVDSNYLWDPSVLTPSISRTFTNSNATVTDSGTVGGGDSITVRTVTAISGKKYAEFKMTQQTSNENYHAFGIISSSGINFISNGWYGAYSRYPNLNFSCGLNPPDGLYLDGTLTGTSFPVFGVDDVIGIAFDSITRKLWISVNGVWANSGDPSAGTNPIATAAAGTYYFSFSNYTCNVNGPITISTTIYPKQSQMQYSIPSGFSAYDPA
jgi:hypothetical protein